MSAPEYEHDDFEQECWNCHGEGVVSSCFEEWACVDPDEGCHLCIRRCDVCRPVPRNADLDAALAIALANGETPR